MVICQKVYKVVMMQSEIPQNWPFPIFNGQRTSESKALLEKSKPLTVDQIKELEALF